MYDVTFPLTAKQKVIGPEAHPLYKWIAAEAGEGAAPKWNFHKYLIGKDGSLQGAWPSRVPASESVGDRDHREKTPTQRRSRWPISRRGVRPLLG